MKSLSTPWIGDQSCIVARDRTRGPRPVACPITAGQDCRLPRPLSVGWSRSVRSCSNNEGSPTICCRHPSSPMQVKRPSASITRAFMGVTGTEASMAEFCSIRADGSAPAGQPSTAELSQGSSCCPQGSPASRSGSVEPMLTDQKEQSEELGRAGAHSVQRYLCIRQVLEPIETCTRRSVRCWSLRANHATTKPSGLASGP